WHPSDGLGRVDVYEHTRVATPGHDLVDRLGRADLVVAPLQVDERGGRSDGGEDLVDVDTTGPVAADDGDLMGAAGHQAVGAEAHGRVLDGRHDEVIAPPGRPV